MSNTATPDQSSAQELYFLYELAKTFSSSLELNEVAEYILDGTCALIGTEQGFLCSLETPASGEFPVLAPYILRGVSSSALQALVPRLQPVWASRQGTYLSQPGADKNDWKDLLAAPLVVRDQVHGILGVSTATARAFTPREQQRLVSVANLAALALENARLHDQIQREVQVLRRLIHAAQQVGQGQLSAEQIAELEGSEGWGEISQLSRVFAQMARQVIEREEALHQKVRELQIVIDEVKRNQQIAEITETEYFQHIQQKVQEMREKHHRL
jgi:GAF domain-containing protein